ncbi:hypothetical protein MmiHf6_01930 [Methanimicrococcus hongohii]|uniref:Uncharacterized protein n=1 Tax=Methanimicrococcus hongohii TaxID=3028295 RepID=A0AA96UYC8_9EURY|nr:hypothetical protein [Methanimicrococcus sp. Hf6]WNY22901.1 hypothetical protein MmiHf6_01930 [Methanimicrococcus sp. Hf6]
MKDYYKTFAVIGWIFLICSVIQIFLFPIFIVPLPLFFIPAAIFFLIAALVKKMETIFPTYLNNDKESFIYNLKIVSYLCYIVAILPLVIGIYNYLMLETAPSFWSSIANLLGLAVTVISIVILFTTGYVIKLLNYGTKNMQVYVVGYNNNMYGDAPDSGEYGEYNDEADYKEEK